MARIAVILLFSALFPVALAAQESSPAAPAAEKPAAAAPSANDGTTIPAAPLDLPVSIDRIKEQLAKPPAGQLRGLDRQPDFTVEVSEKRKLDELVASLDFKAGPVPAGGVTADEIQRVQFPSVSNPLRQPYAAFSQGELTTILVENLVGKYFAGRIASSITAAERERAESAAKAEVRQAIAEYCAAQPDRGAGITICTTPPTQ